MTLDASGNLLVGKTSTAFGTAGTVIKPTTGVTITRSAADPLALNRLSTDGEILGFYKDGSTVGSIGTAGGDIVIYTVGDSGIRFNPNGTLPTNGSGAVTDNAYDLGQSSVRWKDLYLSGGVYLGGTGSANLLDDYEEGTWNPEIYYQNAGDQAAATNDEQNGYYIKIGGVVTVVAHLRWTPDASLATDNIGLKNLPFASVSSGVTGTTETQWICPIKSESSSWGASYDSVIGALGTGQTLISFLTPLGGGNLGAIFGTNQQRVLLTLTYHTSA